MDFLKSILICVLLLGSCILQASESLEAGPVDINRASASELTTLKQIGLKKAQAIVEYRTEHGGFTNIDELANVKGVGENTISINKNRLIVTQ